MTPWVMRLLVANGIVFLLQLTVPEFEKPLMLVPALLLTRPWTIITYMFLHGGFGHLLFNMIALFFFGPRLESRLGSPNFLILYAVSGITGGLLSLVFSSSAIIGASGAIFGVLLGFAMFWPRDQILIWGILPIEARWLVAGMTVLALMGGFAGSGSGVAHFAHLGGFVGGFLSLKFFQWRSPAKAWKRKTAPAAKRESGPSAMARWNSIKRDEMHEVNRAELDRILDQISTTGLTSLTPGDREFLERFSTRGKH